MRTRLHRHAGEHRRIRTRCSTRRSRASRQVKAYGTEDSEIARGRRAIERLLRVWRRKAARDARGFASDHRGAVEPRRSPP
jgi:hypothetical protein